MSNINDTYFNGFYKELWRNSIPAIQTTKELEFMLSYFNLQPGSKVLDLMCGYGRHAIELARKGVAVTAVDNLPDYIHEIQAVAEKESLPLKPVCQGILDYQADDSYDLVICMGNSLNFFNAADCSRLLSTIAGHIKTGGHIMINSWSVGSIIFRNFTEKSAFTVGEYQFQSDSKIFFQPARMESETRITAPDGRTETKKAVDYIYSVNEMENFLMNAGITLTELFSIPGKKKFSVGEPRVYFVGQKT